MSVPKEKIKHQLYRFEDMEVVLHSPAQEELDGDNHPIRVTSWYVQEAKLQRGEVILGEEFEASAHKLQMIGRVVWA